VDANALILLDARVAAWLQGHQSPELAAFLYAITQVNSMAGIGVMTVAFLAVLARLRERGWMLAVALSVGGAILINTLLKEVFQRRRPVFDDPWVVLTTYSFPSGHTASATAFYGVLATFLVSRTRIAVERVTIIAAAIAAVALVAFSRLYLGAHFLTDVVAAAAWAFVWLLLCLSAVRGMARGLTSPSERLD